MKSKERTVHYDDGSVYKVKTLINITSYNEGELEDGKEVQKIRNKWVIIEK